MPGHNYEKQEGSLPQTDHTSAFIVNLKITFLTSTFDHHVKSVCFWAHIPKFWDVGEGVADVLEALPAPRITAVIVALDQTDRVEVGVAKLLGLGASIASLG